MRLANSKYQIDILMVENKVNILTIENPKVYTALINDLWNQCEGASGTWVLSQNDKLYNISKSLKCIINPFELDLNEKHIINKLFQSLKSISDETMLEDISYLNVQILEYIDKLFDYSPFLMKYNNEFNLINLLKLYDVKFSDSSESFLEKIVNYLKAMVRICRINVFVFVGLKQYLTTEELVQLYEFVFYEKINLVLIDNVQYRILNNENIFIIDKEYCIIDLASEE